MTESEPDRDWLRAPWRLSPDADTGEVVLTVHEGDRSATIRLDPGDLGRLQSNLTTAGAAAAPRTDAERGAVVPLVVTVESETAERLAAMNRHATGVDSPTQMAQTVVEMMLNHYTTIPASDFCFEHKRRGCGDRSGQHTETGA